MAVRGSQRNAWALWRPFHLVEREREPSCDPQGLVSLTCARPLLGIHPLAASTAGTVPLSLLTVGIEEVPGTLARVAGPQVLPEFSSQEIQSLLDQRGIRQLALRRQLIDEAGEQICELTARGFRAQPDL